MVGRPSASAVTGIGKEGPVSPSRTTSGPHGENARPENDRSTSRRARAGAAARARLRAAAAGVVAERLEDRLFFAAANDLFANRAPLTGNSVSVTGTTSGATKESGEPAHAGN